MESRSTNQARAATRASPAIRSQRVSEMKVKIEDGVLIVETENVSETGEMEAWRASWQKEPNREKWFECRYYNPMQVLVI